jgi:hypothetical protein
MKPAFLVAMLAMTTLAQAQQIDLPERIERSNYEPARRADPREMPMLVEPQTGTTFRQWYREQKRPPVVLYFDRQLDQMPAGWQGVSRLQIEDVSKFGKEEDSRTITMGVQHNTAAQKRLKSQFAKLFEQSLSLALKKQEVRMLDGVYLHRKLAADKRSAGSDIEFDSLNKSARFVLEVELLFVDGQCDVIASLKELATGEIIATVRQPMPSLNSVNEIDRANKALVQLLMQFKIG